MLGRQRGAEARFSGTPRIFFVKQTQNLLTKRTRLGAVRLPTGAAMLQAEPSFEAVTPPQTLYLAVAQRQHLGSLAQQQSRALHSAEHFHTPQFVAAHRCPLHRALLPEVAV